MALVLRPVHETLEREVGGVSGMSVLDVGCGTGDMLRRLYAGGASRLVGVDASEGMLKAAANLNGGNNAIEFIGAGATRPTGVGGVRRGYLLNRIPPLP